MGEKVKATGGINFAAIALAATALLAGAAVGQQYPTRPIHFIAPSGAGNATDLTLRIVAGKLTERRGWVTVVGNKPGANYLIGTVGALGKHPQANIGYSENLLDNHASIKEQCSISPALHMLPGDATCHHMHVVHGAPANMTSEPRWSYNNIYVPNDALFTGKTFTRKADGLEKGKPFDHPNHPVVYP